MINRLDHALFYGIQHGSRSCVLGNPVGLGYLQRGRAGKGGKEKRKARGKGKKGNTCDLQRFPGTGNIFSDISLLSMALVILILRVVSFFI